MIKKRILHIPNYYPPHVGGIEDVCYNIVSNIDGFDHKVICFNDIKKTQNEVYEGIDIIRCGVVKKISSQSISFSFYKELKNVIKDFNPDIIHFHTPNPLSSIYLLLAISKKVKLILHWHSDIIEQKKLYFFYRPFEKKLLQRADKILTTSPTYSVGSNSLLSFKNKIQTIPNTVNIKKLTKKVEDEEAVKKIKDKYPNKKIIFTFGRHVTYKGLEYLIKASPFISKEAVIIIAGKGPLTSQLKEISSDKKIQFIGRISDDELRQFLYASDIFAFPSITRNEAFGVALAEAMYCGLPSVTFTILHSGVNWVCPHEITGIESPNKDYTALAEAINLLIADPSLRKKLGSNASLRVKNIFTNDAVNSELISVYKSLFDKI